MPETATYGFEFETPQSKPGITLTGDIDGSAPILAEQVDAVIAGIDSRVTATEGDIVAMQDLIPSDTGWISASVSAATGYSLVTGLYRHWGPVVAVNITLTRTGADVTASSAGNVSGDPLVCTINATNARPDQVQRVTAQCFVTSGTVVISQNGTINLADLHSNSALRTDDDIRINATYFVSTFV